MKKQAATQRSFFQWVFKFCELNYFWHKTRGVFFLQLIFECLFFLDATTSLFLLGKRRSPCQEKKEKSGTKLLRRTHVPLRELFWVSMWTKLLYKALKLRLFSGTFDNNFWLTQSLFNSEKFCRLQIIAVRSQNHAYWISGLCQGRGLWIVVAHLLNNP